MEWKECTFADVFFVYLLTDWVLRHECSSGVVCESMEQARRYGAVQFTRKGGESRGIVATNEMSIKTNICPTHKAM